MKNKKQVKINEKRPSFLFGLEKRRFYFTRKQISKTYEIHPPVIIIISKK